MSIYSKQNQISISSVSGLANKLDSLKTDLTNFITDTVKKVQQDLIIEETVYLKNPTMKTVVNLSHKAATILNFNSVRYTSPTRVSYDLKAKPLSDYSSILIDFSLYLDELLEDGLTKDSVVKIQYVKDPNTIESEFIAIGDITNSTAMLNIIGNVKSILGFGTVEYTNSKGVLYILSAVILSNPILIDFDDSISEILNTNISEYPIKIQYVNDVEFNNIVDENISLLPDFTLQTTYSIDSVLNYNKIRCVDDQNEYFDVEIKFKDNIVYIYPEDILVDHLPSIFNIQYIKI